MARPISEWGSDPMSFCNVHLFASDILSLTTIPHLPCGAYSRKGRPVVQVEMVGVVVSLDQKERFIRFVLDDGSGCTPCILWLNHHLSPRFAHMRPAKVEAKAEIAGQSARKVEHGRLLRVQGKLGSFNQQIQIVVTSLQVENDANAEAKHWLDCVHLALTCYNLPPPQVDITVQVTRNG